MKRKPFDYIKSINSKDYIDDINGFSPFLTHKVFSADKDFVFLANAVNLIGNHKIPLKGMYDFYYNTIPQNKKWLKYPKSEKELKEIQYIMEYFGVTEIVAKEYIKNIDKTELDHIIDLNERQKKGT